MVDTSSLYLANRNHPELRVSVAKLVSSTHSLACASVTGYVRACGVKKGGLEVTLLLPRRPVGPFLDTFDV